MSWFFRHKTIDEKFSEAELHKAGFKDLKIGFGQKDIWGRDQYRLLYDPTHHRISGAYEISNPSKVRNLSIEQVHEILGALHHLQHNEGSQ